MAPVGRIRRQKFSIQNSLRGGERQNAVESIVLATPAFAADVVDPEPLPSDHALWRTPGVLISPHVGGRSSAMRPRVEQVVRRQIERLLAGEEPLDVVVRT